MKTRLCITHTYDEAQACIAAAEPTGFFITLADWMIRARVWIANAVIKVLTSFLFTSKDIGAVDFRKIVVYTHGILGDTVVLLPAFSALRRRYRNARIAVIADVGPSPAAPTAILKGSSFIDELIVIDRQPLRRENGALVMDEKVSGIVCDLFIDFAPYGNRGWFKAVIREIILAKKLCARYTIGFHLSAPPINKFTRLVRHGFIQNEPRRAEIILKKLGLTADYDRDLFPADEAEKKAVLGKIAHSGQRHKDFVVMHPGGNMDIQLWATERFAALADKVSEGYGLDIVVTGVKSEADIANKLASSARGKVINLCGETSLQELIEMLRMARACITNDTGTMHVAAMVGTPTLAIFGTRLSPLWWYPVGSKVTALFCFEPCSFCYLDYCGHKNCLQGVNTENVALAFKELLLKNPMPKI